MLLLEMLCLSVSRIVGTQNRFALLLEMLYRLVIRQFCRNLATDLLFHSCLAGAFHGDPGH